MQENRSKAPFILQGHRGVRSLDPSGALENTPKAFIEALKFCREVELDLQLTADQEFIIFHDDVLQPNHFNGLQKRTSVCDLSLTEAQKLFYFSHPEQPLLSLADTVEAIAKEVATNYLLDFELKYGKKLQERWNVSNYVENAIEKILSVFPLERCRIRSFSPEVVRTIKEINPQIQTVALTWAGEFNYLELMQLTKADILAPHMKFINDSQVHELQELDKKVIPYAVTGHGDLDLREDTALFQKLFKTFDGWTSDSPQLVSAAAQKAGISL